MTYRCAVLDDYQNVALAMADWASLRPQVDVTVFPEKITGIPRLESTLRDFDILCLMRERTPIPEQLLALLPRLKLIATTGAQNLSIDVRAALARGIVCCGTPALAHPTVELAFALMLEIARQPGQESHTMKGGKKWQDRVGTCLSGRTLGIVGLGRLGSRVAGIAQAFGMNVIAWSPNLTQERCRDARVGYAGKDELFQSSHVVSLHLQLSPATRHIVDARELGMMRPDSVLINTARGELVNESALLDALRGRRIAGAGIDVYEHEPLAADHAYRQLSNVVITPHIGFVTEDNYQVYYSGLVEAIKSWLAGSPIRLLAPTAG